MSEPPQEAEDGSGPFLERRYSIEIEGSPRSPAELLREIATHLAELAPDFLAVFEKTEGTEDELRVGDELHIRILGPWNGSVRVREATAEAFELETLEGHPEAGRIRFWVERIEGVPGGLRFVIRSRARSRDGFVAFVYGTLGIGKAVQEQMWTLFCERVVERAGGKQRGPVHVVTDNHDAPEEPPEHHTR